MIPNTPVFSMSYDLRSKLVKMPAAGEGGFEGLMAVLLAALTGYRFFVARSGDQPADAVSVVGGIALQCKRYDKTNIDETEFEGDFHKACRTIPSLDCYVVAATRTTGQLTVLAEEIQNANGVDIILLDLDGSESAVAVLCVTFWDQIRTFAGLSDLDEQFSAWAAAEAAKPRTKEIISTLRAILVSSVPHAGVVQRKLQDRLDQRFGLKTLSHHATRFSINLSQAVVRSAPNQQLQSWWTENRTRSAMVVGEEGLGKSWIAAAFANWASLNGSLVVWLDSADWAGANRIFEVIDTGLLLAGYDRKSLRERLSEKAKTRWRDKLLLVLDGVNEQGADVTASKLLAELQSSKIKPCRILFTTRPKQWPSNVRALWNCGAKIEAIPFTDPELDEALSKLTPSVSRSEIPARLLEIARIPRYFHRAIALRSEFQSLINVTIEMVLWADLLDKVNSGHPQLTERIRWQSPDDAKRALSKLAQGARKLANVQQSDGFLLMQVSFGPNFEEIRNDLAEQRVLLNPTGEHPQPRREHVILGFALHLISTLRKETDRSVPWLAEIIAKELEPTLSQDQLTESIFVALQLSILSNSPETSLDSNARSALLADWTSSQNSRIDPSRLAFWEEKDIHAYLGFIEHIFCDRVQIRGLSSLSNHFARGGSTPTNQIQFSLRRSVTGWHLYGSQI